MVRAAHSIKFGGLESLWMTADTIFFSPGAVIFTPKSIFGAGEFTGPHSVHGTFNLLNRVNAQNIDQVYGVPDLLGPVPRHSGDNVGSPANPAYTSMGWESDSPEGSVQALPNRLSTQDWF